MPFMPTRTPGLLAGATVAAGAMLAGATVLPSAAQEPPAPVVAAPLTDRHEFTDDVTMQIRIQPGGRAREVIDLRDASNITVAEITIQPGARFPWHTHPGPVLAAVDGGELVYVYADVCVDRPYGADEAFVDPGGDNIHTAYRSGTHLAVVIATFLDAPDEGPLTIPVDDVEGAELDEACEDASSPPG